MRQLLALAAVFLAGSAAWSASPEEGKALPSFDAVTRIVEKHFAGKPRFERGDIISRFDVEPVIDQLTEIGWRPGDIEELYDAFLPDDATVVVLLRTEAGRQLMKQNGKLPGFYDRLERLTWLADGTRRLRTLLADPKAAEISARWTTPAGAAEMQAQIASDPRGENFALPTGHVLTIDQFLARLKKAHGEAVRRAAKSEG